MKLLPDVYQVAGPCLSHPFDGTAYLLPCADGTLWMIDCGTSLGAEIIRGNIRALGFDPDKVVRILATHGHYDHLSGAASSGVQLFIHDLDAGQVMLGDDVKTAASLLYGEKMPALEVAGRLHDGDSFLIKAGQLRVLHTPGHSPGSCCFMLEHKSGLRLLFAADTLHGGFSPLIGSDEGAWRDSLHRLQEENADCYTFGHCPPTLMFDAKERIRSLAQSFANYYNPWFKDFYREYKY